MMVAAIARSRSARPGNPHRQVGSGAKFKDAIGIGDEDY